MNNSMNDDAEDDMPYDCYLPQFLMVELYCEYIAPKKTHELNHEKAQCLKHIKTCRDCLTKLLRLKTALAIGLYEPPPLGNTVPPTNPENPLS